MAATAASRVLGLVREQVMLAVLGLNAGMGAFTVAFKVPSLVRTLLADTALSAAFIPVFSELLEKGRRAEAWMVARTIILLATLILGGISLLGMAFAPQVISLVAPGFKDPDTIALAVDLTRIMFLSVVVLGVAGRLHGHPEHPRPLHPPGVGAHRVERGHHRVTCLLLAAVRSAGRLPEEWTTEASMRWPGASCSARSWSWSSRYRPCGGGWKDPPCRWRWATRRCVRWAGSWFPSC